MDAEVNYNARDSIKIRVKEKLIILYGDAIVTYQDMEIRAEYITVNFETQVMEAVYRVDSMGNKVGQPHFKDGDDEFSTDSLRYNFKSKKGLIFGLVTEEADGIVTGEKVKKDQYDNLYIYNARYTTCSDTAHPHFYIQARKMKIIPKKKIVSGPAVLFVGDVPTPGILPFGFFPITQGRTSGVIIPTYGYAADRGYFLQKGGYYFGMSDHFDMALTGDIYANGSWRGEATSFYAKRYKFGGNFSLSYAVNKNNEPEDPDYTASRDFLLNWNHQMDNRARPKTTFNATVQLGSSSYLRTNSFNPGDMVTNTMNSSISFSRAFKFGSLSLAGRHTQNTQTGQVDVTLPEMNFDVYRFFPFRGKNYNSSTSKFYQDIGVTYTTGFRNQIQSGDSTFFTPATLDEMRYGMNHRMGVSGNFKLLKFLAFTPSANYTDFWYFQSVVKTFDTAVQTETIPGFVRGYEYSFSANVSTILYGMYRFKGDRVKAIRHVLTPSVSVSYRPDFSEAKYGFYSIVQTDSAATEFTRYSKFDNGIYGGPGGGRSGLLNFSLSNNFEMKVKDSRDTVTGDRKVKLLEVFSVAGSYNFLVDSFQWAPFAIQARTTLFKQVNVQYSSSYTVYGHDSAGRTRPHLYQDQTGKLLRLTNTQIYVTTAFNSETIKGKGTPGRVRPVVHPYMTSQELLMLNSPDQYVDFNIPWNFNLSYIYNLTKAGPVRTETQTVDFSGDFSLSQKWKIGFTSGYNFTNKTLSMTTLNLYRDLHCWEFRFDWMPFGYRSYFAFTLNAKSSVLQDLKLNRKRGFPGQ